MKESENASLAEVLRAVKAVTKRFDDVKAQNPNGFLLIPVQPCGAISGQIQHRLCRKDNNGVDSTICTPVAIQSNGGFDQVQNVPNQSKEKTNEVLNHDVSKHNNASIKHNLNKNKIQTRACKFYEKYSFEVTEEKIQFMKCLRRTRHTAENQDNRVLFNCGQKLMNRDTPHNGGRVAIHKPNIVSKRMVGTKRDIDMHSRKDVKMVDEYYWHNLVQSETRKGRHTRNRNKIGIDTILCLDTSESMDGKPWTQAMEFVRNYIQCVRKATDPTSRSCEHLGLVVFGHETKVLQHMTTDHAEVLQKLDFLYTDGPTPLLGAIHMCMALRSGSGAGLWSGRLSIKPRVLLITDGHLTKGNMVAGPDSIFPGDKTMEKREILELVVMLVEADVFRIYPVPVGDDPDREFLEEIASASKGKVISPDKWEQASRFRNIVDIAGKASILAQEITEIPESTVNESGIDTGRMRINGRIPAITSDGGDDVSNLWAPRIQQMEGATDEDMEEVKELVKHNLANRECTGEDKDHVERSANLPKLGSRVKRGADWTWKNQDMDSTGTVVNHCAPPYENWIQVVWDKEPDSIARYKYGADNRFDVDVVDDPRILQPEELIAIGCIVTRGEDWIWNEQDGGAGKKGTVLNVIPDGTAVVRWMNGKTYPYRFGREGKFDLKICFQNIGVTEVSNVDLGMRKKIKAVNKNKLVEMKLACGLNESPMKKNTTTTRNTTSKHETCNKKPENGSSNVNKQGKAPYKEDVFVIGAEGMELVSQDSE